MTEDYCSAALRHFRDSAALKTLNRHDNSAYLGGYVIECALKMILQVYGHGSKSYGHDLQRLSGEALTLAVTLSPGAARYRVDNLASLQPAVSAWRPELRYGRTPTITNAQAEAISNGVEDIMTRVIACLVLDGHETLQP